MRSRPTSRPGRRLIFWRALKMGALMIRKSNGDWRYSRLEQARTPSGAALGAVVLDHEPLERPDGFSAVRNVYELRR